MKVINHVRDGLAGSVIDLDSRGSVQGDPQPHAQSINVRCVKEFGSLDHGRMHILCWCL